MRLFAFTLLYCLCYMQMCQSYSPSYTVTAGSGEKPWLTGPLLTPAARVVPPGHFNVEPYLYWIANTGKYGNNWHRVSTPTVNQLVAQVIYKIGLIDRVDFSGIIQATYSSTRGNSSTSFNDLPLGLEFQVYADDQWFLKFSLQETFPTGKYQKLDPAKLGTDIGGAGSYATQIAITLSNLHHFSGHHFLSSRFNIALLLPADVKVKGVNAYGGDPSTSGTVSPGSTLSVFYGVEYTLTRNWALAFDLLGVLDAKNSFRGMSILPVGAPSSVQISVAPAIEYNWSAQMGLIVGSWFTVAGRNSTCFTSAVGAFNYYY